MEEQQLRSRSRSKTPFLRSQCDHEECEILETGEHIHKRKKSPISKNPTVTAITEESEISSSPIIVKTSSQRSTRQTKTVTSDYSSAEEISPETSLKLTTAITSPNVVTKTTVITSTRKTITNNNENGGGQKSIQLKEIGQNELNKAFEKIQKNRTSTPNQTKRRISTSVNTTLIDNADLSKHLPFKEYKEAGTYWNKYPKTDYTYSKLSPHRREIAPGIVAMPNMSRQSLDKHHERVNYMATTNPERETEIRARYETTRHIRSSYVPPRPEIHYDSQDEVDLSEFERCHVKKYYTTTTTSTVKKEIWIKRVFTSIFTSIFTTFYWMTDIFRSRDDDETLYYTRYEEKQGFFGRFFSSIKNGVLAIFRRFYIFISSVLYLDSWLLQSSSKLEEDGRNKKRFLLLLLILLPLLLLGAWLLCEETQRTKLLSTLPLTSSLSLSALTSYIPLWRSDSSSSKFNFNFDFNWNPFSSQYNKIENIKSSLSEEEYNNLLNHIKIHIENVVAAKEKNQKVSNEIVILISEIVNENLIKFNYILTDADVERIAEIVRVKIGDVKTEVPFVLNKENFDEIKKVVSENMATDYTVNNNFNFDEILFKILSSEKLVDFIDGRIDGKLKLLANPAGDILSLNEEIKELKLKLEALLGKGKDFDAALGLLKDNQAGFNDVFENYKIENRQRLENIVNEINIKINSGQEKQFVAINDQIRVVLMELMGYKEEELGDVALKDWVQNLFVAKSDLEARLLEIHGNINSNMEIEFQRSSGILMKTVSENLKKEILAHLEKQRDLDGESVKVSGNLDEEHIKKIVAAALAVYDADKTGLVDYALESAGGQILSTRCTESYQTKSAQISVFGIPLWYPTNTPRVAISPSVQPGNCWAFQGFPGFLVLQLNTPIHVTGFTMEHIPKSLAPNGKIDSAPKLFSVWGLLAENDQDSVLFGKYEYLDNTTSLQYFPVQNRENLTVSYQIVELRVESNHGNEHYSCLYRFRIHGTPNA